MFYQIKEWKQERKPYIDKFVSALLSQTYTCWSR